jgi:hypothetical protein
MKTDKAIEILENHTQYFVPTTDLPAFEMAIYALKEQRMKEKRIEKEKLIKDIKLQGIETKSAYITKISFQGISCEVKRGDILTYSNGYLHKDGKVVCSLNSINGRCCELLEP